MRQHPGTAPRAPAGRADDPERPCGGGRGVPVDHLRGTMGRAAASLLQRADRPEHEDAVDRADGMGGRLARPKLCRADRRDPRDGRHRPLLLGRRTRLGRTLEAAPEPRRDRPRTRVDPRAPRLRGRQGDVDPGRAAAGRPPPLMGADPLRLGPDVREALPPLRGARAPPDPDHRGHRRRAVAPGVGDRRDLERHRQPRRLARVHSPRRRDDADVARPRARPGGDSVRARRDRRRTRRRAGRCLPARAAPDPAVARRDRDLRRGAGRS